MTREQALDRLRTRCSRGEMCSGQASALLKRWSLKDGANGLSDKDIAYVIATLISEKFIDDTRFANAFVRDKLKFNGWGKQKIVYKLKSFGLSDGVITEALQENYYGSADGGVCDLSGQKVLEKLLDKKWKSLKADEPISNKKAKAIRFAAGRGFEYGDIIVALNKIMGDNNSFIDV